jgi:hypothetical protein
LESLAVVEIKSSGQVAIIEEEEEPSAVQEEQAELDRLLDGQGRITLDFTIDAPEATAMEASGEAGGGEATPAAPTDELPTTSDAVPTSSAENPAPRADGGAD